MQSGIVKSFNISSKAWYPEPSPNLSGTLTSIGKTVKGTGTKFNLEINEGDYLLNPDTDEVRLVSRIESDTHLILESAFSSDLDTATCKRIKNKSIRGLQIAFSGTNPGTIKGATQNTGGTWPVGVRWNIRNENGIDPQLVTPGESSAAHITILE